MSTSGMHRRPFEGRHLVSLSIGIYMDHFMFRFCHLIQVQKSPIFFSISGVILCL